LHSAHPAALRTRPGTAASQSCCATSPRTGPLGPPVRSPQRAVTGSRAPSAGTPAPFSGGIGASFLADRSDLCHIHRSNPDEGVIVEPKHPPQDQLDAPPVPPLARRAFLGRSAAVGAAAVAAPL